MNIRYGLFNLILALTLVLGTASRPMPDANRAVLDSAASSAAVANLTVYDNALATGWADWSWNASTSFANTSQKHSGSSSISVGFTQAWDGFQLGRSTPLDLTGYSTFRFWIYGGNGGQTIQVTLTGGVVCMNAQQTLTATNAWKQVDIPLADMGSPASVTTIQFFNNTGGTQPTFYLDDILFLAGTSSPTAPQAAGPALTVDAAAGRKLISPLIYGMNFADEILAAELNLPINRWGGNATTRYNWQNDTSNHASDWFFENIPEDNPNPGQLPIGSAADRFVEQNKRTGTNTLLTVPLIGWTPKSRAFSCTYYSSKFPNQDQFDSPYHSECGNGKLNNVELSGGDPTVTSTPITESFVAAWINHLKSRYGSAGQGGVTYYNLDNEPMLWNSTHRDVHPLPTTYDEMQAKTYAYAAAIKAADSAAQTLGPVLWGWCAYFYSAKDGCGKGSDYASHGNKYFLDWYLGQMQAYETQYHVRILDYLDVHMYPQGDQVFSDATDPATAALRLRSTRALWDPTYKDESWINDYVNLIPRMHQWVTNNYPGTKTAISEYNFGSQCSVNGALTQADALGIFGREGLDLATLWTAPASALPGAYAFRLFRNYDGAGHKFGETSLSALSADSDKIAVFAAQRASDGALTLLFINKTASDLTAPVQVKNFSGMGFASVFRYSAAKLNAIQSLPSQSIGAGTFSATFAANSITLWVVPLNLNLPDKLYLPALRR